MGSTGRTAGSSSNNINDRIRNSPDYVGQTEVENQIANYVRYGMLGEGEDFVAVGNFTIESNPGNGELGDVTAEYQVRVDTSYDEYDADGYRYTVPSSEYEWRTDTFQVQLKRRKRATLSEEGSRSVIANAKSAERQIKRNERAARTYPRRGNR